MDEQGNKDQSSGATPTITEITNSQSTFRDDLHLKPNSKFTLKRVRTIDNHTLTDDELTSLDQIPDYILNTLMIANYHAREFKFKPLTSNKNKTKDIYDSDESEDEDEDGVNPMDALLGVFHCSDDSLRRYITIKLSACQLSVPFLLPDPAAPSEKITILLSALESITKSWKGASDDNESAQQVFATEHPFPVVSFIRIGKTTMSKSSLMNKIMSDGSRDHDFFFHKDIKGGDVRRKIVDGLVELSWYLPGGSEEQTLQNEICFANLRGDARYFKKQLDVLSKISSVLCILLPSEYPDEAMRKILEEATHSKPNVILLFNEIKHLESKKYFNNLRSKHRGKLSLITKAKKSNETIFLQSTREKIQKNIHEVKATPLVELASCASEYGIQLDDDQSHYILGKSVGSWLEMGIKEAKNLLKLQMHIPELADLEREKYRSKRQGNKSSSDRVRRDVGEIYQDIEAEKQAQKESFAQLDERILRYLNCIAMMDETERNYALNKVKHQLDKMSLKVMAKLHQDYRVASLKLQKKRKETPQRLDTRLPEEKDLKQLEESISKYSFGLEHIIRELAQLYQLEESKYDYYAGAAAEMLLSGQPLELVDGDSSYIPMRWFNAIYSKLEHRTNNAKVFVISVLGSQSSGKSTMLNTMFGLEFPVSAGSCTRGAFASLIPVSDSLKCASNFDYVLIIDTEGLKGSADPMLREHDNDLATFAIGVADVTIVNIFGENHNGMKEFLEIAVHAFLKMKLVKEKKTCKIVHQNVPATDATDRIKLKEDLDKMANAAAIQENCEDQFQKLNDIISFDENTDVFYVPNLLKGSPPMAPVNPNYGKTVQKVKEDIISLMCACSLQCTVSQFRERVDILWKSMLKESSVFRFHTTIEVRAHTSLDRKYLEESANLFVIGMAELERKVQVALSRCTTRNERKKKWAEWEKEIHEEGEAFGKKREKAMKDFFETSKDRATLEQWRENAMTKIKQQKEIQVLEVTKNCLSTLHYLQNRQDVEETKQTYEKELLQKARKFITSAHNTDDADKCLAAFEQEWQQWIVDVPECWERKTDVNSEMVIVLCKTDLVLTVEIEKKLTEQNYIISNFKKNEITIGVDDLTYNMGIIQTLFGYSARQTQCLPYAEKIKQTAVKEALDFAKKTSESGVRCTSNDLTKMYHDVMTTIDKGTGMFSFKFSNSLKCDILLYIFAYAYEIFDEMEERYIQERDIKGDLERTLRPELETYFENVCKKMGKEMLAATSFVDALRKQIESELNRTMGLVVTGEMLNKSEFQSNGQFHASVLIQLGEEGKFESYIPYLNNPLGFLRTKLGEAIENYCLIGNPVSITSLLEDQVKKIDNDVYAAITTANEETKTGSKKLTFWIQRFVEECSTLAIKKETFSVATIEDLEDIEVFQGKVLENVTQPLESLNKRGVDLPTFRKWNPSPLDCLSNRMFFCQCSCPFCEALCDQTFDHDEHSTLSHRPVGIIGYTQEKTRKLGTSICTMSVAGKKEFRNLDTFWKWIPYKDYKSVNDRYKSWSIPENKTYEPSKYWQWFMATFSKKLAEHYEANEPEIPIWWKFLSFRKARDHLRREYNM